MPIQGKSCLSAVDVTGGDLIRHSARWMVPEEIDAIAGFWSQKSYADLCPFMASIDEVHV